MKKLSAFILLIIILAACNAQTSPASPASHEVAIKKQADKMVQFLLQKDYVSFTNFTHPKLVEMMGGKEKMISEMEGGIKEMEAQGNTFSKVSVGEPSKIITANKELQCTIPQSIELKVPGGRLVTKSTLIAISTDNGKTWVFIDTSGKDLKTMQSVFPNLSNELVIPQKQEPVFSKE